ncbi:MAG: hypothetical protein C3L24_12665, partial [Candidatus Sedimenticola endophacoides]
QCAGRSRDERRTVGAVTAVALASRFWGLGCPKIFHEVATLLFLTLSANTQRAALEQAIGSFGGAAPEACVLTKVDEAATLGGALSALLHSRMPLAFTTDGQKVPEDLHLAHANTLVSRAALDADTMGERLSDEYLALSLGAAGSHASI